MLSRKAAVWLTLALCGWGAAAAARPAAAMAAMAVTAATAALPAGTAIEQVMAAPFVSGLVAARQGERIAWVVNRRGERNVWVADGPGFVPRQVTHYRGDEGQPLSSLRLTPDGWSVVYVRGSELNEAGEAANPASRATAPKQQVWALDVEAGAAGKAEPRLLGDLGCSPEDCEDVEISPDGRQVVWEARHRLWLAPVAGGAPPRSLHDLRGDSTTPRWSPDGRRIAFRLDRSDHSYIAVFDLAAESVRYIAPSVDRDELPRWSPDGAHIAFIREPAAAEKLPLIPERPRPWSLWVGDPATGAARQVWPSSHDLSGANGASGAHGVNGTNGAHAANDAHGVNGANDANGAHEATGAKGAHEATGANDASGSLPPFADGSLLYAAGERIVFASEQNEGGRNHLYALDAAGGGAPRLLTPGDYDVEDVALAADGRSVLFSANEHAADPDDEDRRHLWRVSPAGGTPQALTAGRGIEWSPAETGDGRAVVCIGSTATTPGQVHRLTAGAPPAASREALAGQLPADFPAGELVVPRAVLFKSGDGTVIHGQLFLPRGAAGGGHPQGAPAALPALIFTHGGPVRQMLLGFHYMYYYHNAYAMNQALASRGYVVLSVNYRLGIMYGRAFRQAAHAGWRGAAEYGDVVAGARYLQSLPQVDPRRIGLWGGSYGGLLTALGLARNSDLFAAGVDFHGIHDWSLLLPSWEISPAAAPDAHEAYQLAFSSSPLAAIESWRSPVLLIHGDDDRNVPFAQTRDLVQHLRAHQVPFEELIFPDEIHDLLLWKSWVAAYQAAADFLDRHLKAPRAAGAARVE